MLDWNGRFAGVRRLLLRYRRTGAALLAGLAVLLTIGTLAPDQAAGRPMVVAARDLAAGDVLTSGDLRVVRVPSTIAPASALRTSDGLLGRRLAGPVGAGEPVTTLRLAGRGLLWHAPPGSALAVVRVADPVQVDLLSPGDRVDVYAAARGGGARIVLSHALVLALPPTDTGGLASTSVAGAAVVVETTADGASRLAGASAISPLFIALVR